MSPAVIKTGATTWAERSLLATGWYPPDVRSAAARLRYYASQFPLVENDAGYWALPAPEQVETWARTVPAGFTMNMKAHALLTGHYTDPRRLPRDVRDALGGELLAKPHVYPQDLGPELMRELSRRFHEALVPLHRRGQLGVVLFQFPVWFAIGREHKETLSRIRQELLPYRVAVEFRNATWMSEGNRHETLALLAAEGLIYTCVDEPQGFPSSVPPLAAATGDLAVVRLHGRNGARWHRGARTAAERFEYLYPAEELREWVPKIRALAERTREVHVLMNNCYGDYAVRNAREMAELLEEARDGTARAAPEHAPA
ncbi:MAG TPA: DUF72 domain-containing protein [Polyangia bacterium]|jgi:uncharacterized protein YecE (DUF72 family)